MTRSNSANLNPKRIKPPHRRAICMSNLATLREEHAQLIAIVRRLGAIIAQQSPPPSTELDTLRRELRSTLIRHLKAEDWILYPRLFKSPDPVIAETALRFNTEMGGL